MIIYELIISYLNPYQLYFYLSGPTSWLLPIKGLYVLSAVFDRADLYVPIMIIYYCFFII